MIDFAIESNIYGGARIWIYEAQLNAVPGLSGFMELKNLRDKFKTED